MKLITAAALSLSLISAPVMADWVHVGSDSRSNLWFWYPIQYQGDYAYVRAAARYKYPIAIRNWAYKAQSALTNATIDCFDGSIKLTKGTFYTGRNLNGRSVRIQPTPWIPYNQLTRTGKMGVIAACQ